MGSKRSRSSSSSNSSSCYVAAVVAGNHIIELAVSASDC